MELRRNIICAVPCMLYVCSISEGVPESYCNAASMNAFFHVSHLPSMLHMNANGTCTFFLKDPASHPVLGIRYLVTGISGIMYQVLCIRYTIGIRYWDQVWESSTRYQISRIRFMTYNGYGFGVGWICNVV